MIALPSLTLLLGLLSGCKSQSLSTEKIIFSDSSDPNTTALHYQLRSSLRISDDLTITFQPIIYSRSKPLSSVSRTNYSFYHSHQILPAQCCKGAVCTDKVFHLDDLKLKFQDKILSDTKINATRQAIENIQQWLDNSCSLG